ncbi:MAG TPA: sugar ABC transporter permease [Thauera sp.]|uniref:carbohydrate ABC transporter permease n=1 Tax=Thauera sp. TaxID=1905334 RepID=UPI002CB337F0|nr:sugar ABC transporter permease [Thauera sp.]HRP23495.1 sugar ABC transporter permease [Thauera sp.]HRP66079.1 sugar ABC transporter permease [Thauera sp.]
MNPKTELAAAAASPSAPAAAHGRKRSLQSRRARAAWLLVAPTLVLLAGVAGWPLLRTLLYSFTDARLDTPDEYELVGFANYLDFIDGEAYGVLADPLWWQAIYNTLWFTVISVSLELFFGLLLALLMNQKFRGQGLVRTAILVPWAIPTIVTAKMFSWMFHDQYGTINDLLMRIGMIDAPLAWIAEPTLSLWAVVIADVWKTIPFMALMLLAALQMVPSDLYEAARVDGASAWQRFRRITLPLIFPAMLVALIFRTMDALRVFDLIYVLTSNSEATISISGYAREQMVVYQEMGVGSAASVLVFMMVAGVAAVFLYIGRIAEPKEKQA